MYQLRIPGPTPCPEEVLLAGAKPMVNHRGREFSQLIQKITAQLKEFFQTKNDLLILTTSGTGGMEAAVVNTLSPGDKVLAISIGYFGDRFTEIASTYGAQVVPLKFEWGTPADPEAVRRALRQDPEIKAVLVTHNETSTGITNDLKAISAIAREYDKLLLVDGVSSVGSIDLPTDEWGCDVVVTASQKGWMTPPGLAMVSVSAKAWEANKAAKMPRFYFDFTRAKNLLGRGQTPWTPAVSVLNALDEALDLLAKDGPANVIARHQRVAARARAGVKSLGLSIIAADERYASNTVTAVKVPEGVDATGLLHRLIEEQDVELAEGQGPLAGKIFRIGHLGYVTEADIDVVINGLKAVLPKVGYAGALPR